MIRIEVVDETDRRITVRSEYTLSLNAASVDDGPPIPAAYLTVESHAYATTPAGPVQVWDVHGTLGKGNWHEEKRASLAEAMDSALSAAHWGALNARTEDLQRKWDDGR